MSWRALVDRYWIYGIFSGLAPDGMMNRSLARLDAKSIIPAATSQSDSFIFGPSEPFTQPQPRHLQYKINYKDPTLRIDSSPFFSILHAAHVTTSHVPRAILDHVG